MPYFAIKNGKTSSLVNVYDETVTKESYASQINVSLDEIEELTAQEYDIRLAERSIKYDLGQVDRASIRALRALYLGNPSDDDLNKLKECEARANELRIELHNLRS